MDPITGILINLIIGVILSAASTLLSQAFGSKEQRRTGTRGSAQIGGKVPQYFLVGTVGEAGKLEYQNAWGNDGEVPNAYLTGAYSFGDLSITRMVGLFVNGVRVTFTEAGLVAQGYPVPEYPSNLWWKFYDGTQSTADSYLIDKFGGDADRPWDTDMIGRGVPYLITTALWSETLWTGFPSFVGEFEGIPLYDPRQDSTAGGSGPQRWGNPSTWAFSDNSMVIIYNIERGIYYNEPGATTLGAKVWGGSSTQAQLPYAPWAAAMDACDLAIDLVGGGTEKQFRAGRRINLNERPADVIKELLIGCNSRISHASDGTVYPLVGVPSTADGAFSDADVLATEPLGSIPFPNLDSIINGATATYREPSQAWEDKETAPYYRSDLEAEDDGRQQVEGLDLGTTFSGTQAQRVIKAVIEEGRRFKTHVVALPPEFAQYRPLQVLAWTSGRFDYSAKLFLITARTRSPWGQVVFGLQEVDPADHNWVPSTDEQPLSFTPVVDNRPTPQTVSGFYVEPGTDTRRTSIDVFWDASSVTVDVRFVRISHRRDGDTADRWVGLIPRPNLLLGSARIFDALLPNDAVEFQIQYIPDSGRVTVESSWLPITTPNVKLTSLDVELDEIADEVEERVAGLEDWARHNTRETIEEKRKAILLNVAGAVGGFTDRVLIRREAISEVVGAKAQFTEDILAATGPGSAIVVQLTELSNIVTDPTTGLLATNAIVNLLSAEVSSQVGQITAINNSILSLTSTVGNFSADGLLRIQTVATSAGAVATAAFGVAASSGETMGSSAIYLNALSDGSSDAFVVASRFAVKSTPAGTSYGIFAVDSGVVYIDDAMIRNASIGTAKIADAAITAAKIADATITSAKIGNAAITSAKIGDLQVGTIKLADGAVTSSQTASAADGNASAASPVTLNMTFGSFDQGVIQLSVQVYVPGTTVPDAYDFLSVTLKRGSTILREEYATPVSVSGSYVIYGGWRSFMMLDIPAAPGSVSYSITLSTNRTDLSLAYTSFRVVGAYTKK